MKECEVCGHEIADHASKCPFFEGLHRLVAPTQPRVKVKTVNLEAGLPRVEEALIRLAREIANARQMKIRVLRIIHGWGSSGKGGKLRDACRAF
jgi:dsDNA-specific endonuclease/ATPase MutS2